MKTFAVRIELIAIEEMRERVLARETTIESSDEVGSWDFYRKAIDANITPDEPTRPPAGSGTR